MGVAPVVAGGVVMRGCEPDCVWEGEGAPEAEAKGFGGAVVLEAGEEPLPAPAEAHNAVLAAQMEYRFPYAAGLAYQHH